MLTGWKAVIDGVQHRCVMNSVDLSGFSYEGRKLHDLWVPPQTELFCSSVESASQGMSQGTGQARALPHELLSFEGLVTCRLRGACEGWR